MIFLILNILFPFSANLYAPRFEINKKGDIIKYSFTQGSLVEVTSPCYFYLVRYIVENAPVGHAVLVMLLNDGTRKTAYIIDSNQKTELSEKGQIDMINAISKHHHYEGLFLWTVFDGEDEICGQLNYPDKDGIGMCASWTMYLPFLILNQFDRIQNVKKILIKLSQLSPTGRDLLMTNFLAELKSRFSNLALSIVLSSDKFNNEKVPSNNSTRYSNLCHNPDLDLFFNLPENNEYKHQYEMFRNEVEVFFSHYSHQNYYYLQNMRALFKIKRQALLRG